MLLSLPHTFWSAFLATILQLIFGPDGRKILALGWRALMGRSREELEDLWRKRLEDATEVHQFAAMELKRIMAARDSGMLMGHQADALLRQAAGDERRARLHLARTLQIFSDLVLGRKLPDDMAG